MRNIIIIFGILCILSSCSKAYDSSEAMSGEQARTKEISYLGSALSKDILEYSNLEISGVENVFTGSEKNINYIGLKLFSGQKLQGFGKRMRSEISIDYPYTEGQTIRYQWDFKIPKEFPSDAPKNRWWIIGQWHDQPDVSKGETWDDFPEHSPPILLGYGFTGGKDVISISTGIDGSTEGIVSRGIIPISRGVWNTLYVDITWSQKNDGKVVFYLNRLNKPVLTVKGPNMLNSYQHYFKLGMYRDAKINTDNTLYLRQVKISPK